MMDPELGLRRLRREASDPEVGLILLDMVLGDGAHPDPASELAPVIADVKAERALEVAVVVIGTEQDPQDLEAQIDRLRSAGAEVFRDTSEAVAHASQLLLRVDDTEPGVDLEDLQAPFQAINVGVESFHSSLRDQGAGAVQVDWRPPAGGNEKLIAILEKMKK